MHIHNIYTCCTCTLYIYSHSYTPYHNQSTPSAWIRNNWYAKIVLWILFAQCDFHHVYFIGHAEKEREREGGRDWEKIPFILSCANGQLLFRLIHLILCFGIFGSLHFRAVNFRLKSWQNKLYEYATQSIPWIQNRYTMRECLAYASPVHLTSDKCMKMLAHCGPKKNSTFRKHENIFAFLSYKPLNKRINGIWGESSSVVPNNKHSNATQHNTADQTYAHIL